MSQPSTASSATASALASAAGTAASAKLEAKRVKAEKAAMRRIKKCMQPKECLKHVTVLLDNRLANHPQLGPALIGCLNGQQVISSSSSSDCPSPLPALRWRRDVQVLDPAAFADLAPDALKAGSANILAGSGSKGFEQLEEDVLLVMEGRQLAAVLSSSSASSRVDAKQQLDGLVFPAAGTRCWSPTLVVYELERHVTQTSRAAEGNALRAKVQNQPPPQKRQKAAAAAADTSAMVSRLQCEEAFLDLQLSRGVTVRVVEEAVQLGKLAYALTKAIAERPFKAARLDSAFSFHVGGVGAGCRLDDALSGMDELWLCQLQCFPLVTGEVARAIQRAFPSPGHLLKAYAACANSEEAVRLVADIQVNKGTGPLSTARRLGPELGRRLYAFYSARDPNLVL